MNQFNALNGEEPNELQIEWNRQPTSANLKPRTYPPNTTPMVSSIMSILNHHVIDNGDVEVHSSEFPI